MGKKDGLGSLFDENDDSDRAYDKDDPNGARGIARAEYELRKRGYPSAFGEKKSIKDIVFNVPSEISSHPDVNSIIKKDLTRLKEAGYTVDIKYFRGQDNTGKWNYYLKVLRDNGYFAK